jgi:peptidoglycan/xylan/chitin deacetylase (PgdA/CDA1 family)
MRRLVRRLRRLVRPRGGPAILMYHRIATPAVDPWGLSVSPERFAEQVHAFRQRRTILSMDTFVMRLRSASLPRNAMALTFDDGYMDNFQLAKPILEKAGVPATIFLTTARIGTTEQFWWDELAHMVLLSTESVRTKVTMETERLPIDLPPGDPLVEPRAAWRAWDEPVTARETMYLTLWRALRHCGLESRATAMAELRASFGTARPSPDSLPMRAEDVGGLASNMISVGAHGQTHQPLTSLPPSARLDEIQRSRSEAEELSRQPVTGFAYPHGDRDAATIDMVKRAGFDWACSTHEAPIDTANADRYDLPRIAVHDWPAGTLLSKLGAFGP